MTRRRAAFRVRAAEARNGGADIPGASESAAELAGKLRERVDLVVETRCAERTDWSGFSDEEVEAATLEFVKRMRALRRRLSDS